MEYVSIRVSTLRGNSKIPFNAYVLINGKHILLNRSGDSFEGERLTRLKQKSVKKMYIPASEEPKYREYLESNMAAAYDKNSKKDMASRAEIAQGLTQANTEAVMENPEDEGNYNLAKAGAGKYAEFLLENNDSLKHVLALGNEDKSIVHHSVSVSGIASSLARHLGITMMTQFETLALGATLHDMGLSFSNFNRNQDLTKLSPEDLKIYREHPRTAVQKINELKHFEAPVMTIIMEHEELSSGKGFPQGLTEKKIDKLALICGVANCFDRFVTFGGLKPDEALKKMFLEMIGQYPLGHLNALKAALTESKVI